jgi:hypothetical protein
VQGFRIVLPVFLGGDLKPGQTTASYGLKLHTGGWGMAKTKISSTDLIWVFTEKLRSFGDCAPTVSIAIVPSKDGWTAVTNAWARSRHPLCAKRIEQIQKQLREIYVLAKD